MKTKYEALRGQLEQNQLARLPVIQDLLRDVDSARREFKSDQSFFRYLALLINFQVMAQGSIGTAAGSEKIDSETLGVIKEILSDKIDHLDLQFSYICCLAQRLNLADRDKLIERLASATTLENSSLSLSHLKVTSIANVLSAVKKCLNQENNSARRIMLLNLQQCCEKFTDKNFDPLTMPGQQDYISSLQRFCVGPDQKPAAYFETILKLEKEEQNTRLTQEIRSSIAILKNGAAQFFHNFALDIPSKNQCNTLMNKIHKFLTDAVNIQIQRNNSEASAPDTLQLHELLLQATDIRKSITQLESVAPRTELNWTRIIVVSALTVLVGALLWVIPSLAISGQSSFFRKSPLISEARELVENIEGDLSERIREIDRKFK